MNEAVRIVINDIIKNHNGAGEGCELVAYFDKPGKVWTVGYGCTGPDIKPGTTWTQAQAESALIDRVTGAYNLAIHASPILKTASPSKQAAITDLIYNMGLHGYVGHSLKPLVDAGQWHSAAVEIKKFDHAGGVVQGGLTKRRLIESNLLIA